MTQQFHSKVIAWRNWKRGLEPVLVCQCSEWRFSQQQKEETTPVSVSREMDGQKGVHTMECDSAIKRNEVLMQMTTRMDLENMLREWDKPGTRTQIMCDSTYVVLLTRQVHRNKVDWGFPRWGWGGGIGSYCLMCTSFCLGWGKDLGLVVVVVVNVTELYT